MPQWIVAPVDATRVSRFVARLGRGPGVFRVMALGTTTAASTLVAASGILASAARVPTGEMPVALELQVVLDVAVAGTLVQISLLSFLFLWEKYRQWRTGATQSNLAAESPFPRQLFSGTHAKPIPSDIAS